MNIWILNHYATNQYSEHGGRHYEFAKYLIKAGYDVHIFCASTVHNTNQNMIIDGRLCYEDTCDGIPFVFVKTRNYLGNGKQRILNMFDYYRNVQKVKNYFERPDVIIGSSVHPLACVAAISLAKKLRCKSIAEIRDLWPESIVSYGILGSNSVVVKLLYYLEKWIYTKADRIVFTMEGGNEYIIEKGWDKEHGGTIDLRKVHYINNGVDIEAFRSNALKYVYTDLDFEKDDHFKCVYTGSVRAVNGVSLLLRAAEALSSRNENVIRIYIFGDGDELETLVREAKEKGLTNIVFKGKVEKHYIPSILMSSNVCILNWKATPIIRFGMSMNKLFEYLAAGKPIVENNRPGYDLIENNGCGFSENIEDGEKYAELLVRLALLEKSIYHDMCKKSLETAENFDFVNLSDRLMTIINGLV